MDTATNHTQQVQGKKPSSSGGNDKTKTNIVTTATDGTTKQQLNMMPGGGNFLQLIPETRGGGNTSLADTFQQTDANAFLELIPEIRGGGNASQTKISPADLMMHRIQGMGTSRDELDRHAVDLMETMRDCICYPHKPTERLAGHTKAIQDVLNDASTLDAMAGFLDHLVGPGKYGRAEPTPDQIMSRSAIRSRLWQIIIDLRHRPLREEEIADLFGDLGSDKEEQGQSGEEERDEL